MRNSIIAQCFLLTVGFLLPDDSHAAAFFYVRGHTGTGRYLGHRADCERARRDGVSGGRRRAGYRCEGGWSLDTNYQRSQECKAKRIADEDCYDNGKDVATFENHGECVVKYRGDGVYGIEAFIKVTCKRNFKQDRIIPNGSFD